MKKLLLPVIIVATVFASDAQKVDLDKFNFVFEYRDLPLNPLNAEYKTFSVNVNALSSVRSVYSTSEIEETVDIQGLKRVSGATGHVIVNLELNDLIINSSQVSERVDIQKDKDGKETGRKYYYKMDVTYSWKGNAALKDYKGASINSWDLGSSATSTWSSSEYSSRSAASDYYNNNRTEIKGNLIREEVKKAISWLNGVLSNNYGYSVRKDYEILWILDSKKHPEYQAQKDTWEAFKAAVASVNNSEFPEATRAKFDEFIKYFDSVIAKYVTDDKGEKKLRYAGFYNKAKLYLFLDNPEAAIKEAEGLIANGYDDGDGKRLKKEAESLIEAFQKNNTASRHFQIDLSGVQPPAVN